MAGNSPQETPYICMAACLLEAAEPTNARASGTPTTPLQPGFAQPHSSPRPTFSTACRLPAGTHGATQQTRRQQPQLARAPARHHSPIERDLSPGQWRTPSTPTTQPSAQGPCWLGRAHRRAKKPVHGRPALHLGAGSATIIRYPAQVATTDSVDLRQTHQAS